MVRVKAMEHYKIPHFKNYRFKTEFFETEFIETEFFETEFTITPSLAWILPAVTSLMDHMVSRSKCRFQDLKMPSQEAEILDLLCTSATSLTWFNNASDGWATAPGGPKLTLFIRLTHILK